MFILRFLSILCLHRTRHTLRLAVALTFAGLLVAPARALERLEPASGCYIGMLMSDHDRIPTLSARLGLTPAAFTRFFVLPLTPQITADIREFLHDVRRSGAIAVLTLEPFSGLETVTPAQCDQIADLCAEAEAQGISGIMLRFAHEMNGHWYPWCQKPALYRQVFQLLAGKVHARTSRTAMLWSPNNGLGYPYGRGAHSAAVGSADFAELDTNKDGILSEADDMFGPYYPGDSSVDWVGLTIYHWGLHYPWLENEMPQPGEFARAMNAAGPGSPVNYARWFYARYCADGTHNKPMAIPETSAFYNVEQPGANELAMKQAWFRQIYNISGGGLDGPDIAVAFPKLKCVSWFDHFKREAEAQWQFVDWRASENPLVRDSFLRALRTLRNGQPYFLSASDVAWSQSPSAILPKSLPAILPLTGNLAATVEVKAETACDLVIDLLDQNFLFHGGTRLHVSAGVSTVSATFPLIRDLVDGARYRWSIFLTPTGGTHENEIWRLKASDPVARAMTPGVSITSHPPSIVAGEPFKVRVRYTTAGEANLELKLTNTANEIRASGSISVSRGDGVVELSLAQEPGNSPGAYALTARLASIPPAPSTLSAPSGVQIEAAPLSDRVTLPRENLVVAIGEVLRFPVGYAASTSREARVELVDASGVARARAVQMVGPGSGLAEMTMAFPSGVSATYFARAHLVPPGRPLSESVASSDSQPVRLVTYGYWNWTRDRWGIVFGDDPIHPLSDPDRDHVPNESEYVALTEPRDPASRFRARMEQTDQTLRLTWPSSLTRRYQVFSRPDLQAETWRAVTPVLPGTGEMMQFHIDRSTSGSQGFYRVEVSVP